MSLIRFSQIFGEIINPMATEEICDIKAFEYNLNWVHNIYSVWGVGEEEEIN